MEFWNWVKSNEEAIVATSAMFSALGIIVAALGLWVSGVALRDNRKATKAQTFFDIQRFGFEFAQSIMSDPDFERYLRSGIAAVPSEARSTVVRKFAALLSGYNVIAFQRHFGYIDDPEWALYKIEFCALVQTEGANYYFWLHPIENSQYDQKFKNLIIRCRAFGPEDLHATAS